MLRHLGVRTGALQRLNQDNSLTFLEILQDNLTVLLTVYWLIDFASQPVGISSKQQIDTSSRYPVDIILRQLVTHLYDIQLVLL